MHHSLNKGAATERRSIVRFIGKHLNDGTVTMENIKKWIAGRVKRINKRSGGLGQK